MHDEVVSDMASDSTRNDGNWNQHSSAVDVDRGREDFEELRAQVTKHSIVSNNNGRDEEQGFDLERFLRGTNSVLQCIAC